MLNLDQQFQPLRLVLFVINCALNVLGSLSIFLIILLLSYALSTNSASSQGNECSVTVQNGTVFGRTVDTANPSKKVCAYIGIPFASPPVGPLRFKPPQPAQAWGSMNATRAPNWCPQTDVPPPGFTVAEDCLYLNVYQPQNVTSENLPVMIWFHGGGFTLGSSELFTPTKLLARGDVILVVAHYRLGLLGFLSTGDDISPGNYGLRDQQLSIRWVHENIRAFGGNPGQVTIFGESAGAASVMLHLLSPWNKGNYNFIIFGGVCNFGLIHGVIAQSGTAIATWATDPEPAASSAKLMAERLDCPTNSSSEMVDCLRNLDWQRIVLEQDNYAKDAKINNTYPNAAISPVIEPDLPGAFISQHPLEIMKNGDIDNVPVMLGANKHDGSFDLAGRYVGRIGPLELDKNPEYMRTQLIPDLLKSWKIEGDEGNRGVASSIELAYLDGVNRSSWNDSMPGLVDIMSVFAYKSPAQATADILTRRGLKVYLYSFEHHSENTLWSLYFNSSIVPIEHGISHLDELMYLFDYPAEFSAEDQRFSETFCELWTNFGIFGNPTPSPSDRYDDWPSYNVMDESYMKLNLTPTAMSGYRSSWRPNGFERN